MKQITVLLSFLSLLAGRCVAEEGRPNIVMIVSDDHAWTDYGFMGHERIRTPNLDRLAAQGLTFSRGYVPSSLCCPSLASMITGKYPRQHGITSNDPPRPAVMKAAEFQKSRAFLDGREAMNRMMDVQATLPRLLGEKGYLSFQSGKWWQGDYTRGGFTHGMTVGGRHGDKGLEIGRKTMRPIFDFIGEAKKQGKPFFVWYAPLMPHDPHTPPARFLERYKEMTPSAHVARYWAMVEWFDETCGQLMDHLEREGVADNTIVVYVADNGWIQSPDNPRFAAKSKQSQYDGGLRTPILVRWPGKVKPRRSEAVVSSLDLMPTLLDAAGVARPAGLAGVSLLDDAAVAARGAVFGECYTHDAQDLKNPEASLRWRWVIEGDWKLIEPSARNEPGAGVELYDLKNDPKEERNLAGARPEVVERLSGILAREK